MPKRKFDRRARWVRHRRVTKRVIGSPTRPRLAVFRSNKQTYAQIIDDSVGVTLAAASTIEPEITADNKTDAAATVGASVAKRAMAQGVRRVVFDRGGYVYHGRVKALADAARAEGLEF